MDTSFIQACILYNYLFHSAYPYDITKAIQILSLLLFIFYHSYYLYFITKAIINICCLFLE